MPAKKDAKAFFELGKQLEDEGKPHEAARVYDYAYGMDPLDDVILFRRMHLLDRLSITEHGINFCYIPGGSFLMGSLDGEPDEKPVHQLLLNHYWLSDTPISWALYCHLMDWQAPSMGLPKETGEGRFDQFFLYQENKVRVQYCEDETEMATDWHAHLPDMEWQSQGKTITSREMLGEVPRTNPELPFGYQNKPMVSVSWQEALDLCQKISGPDVSYRLPTEAEWEKGARGGLIGLPFPWGAEPPNAANCDFDRFDRFSIQPMRQFPPNGYGLYAMSGGVWEWTQDWYDAEYYAHSPKTDPTGPAEGTERVLRGGSWSDCVEAQTVSFRMSRASRHWSEKGWGAHVTPNIGFRICRTEKS